MITKAALLFLFGTTLTSGQFWPHMQLAPFGVALAPTSNGCPSGPELAPLICKFMQQNIAVKPQLIAPSTYIAPLVLEKCDNPKLQIEMELPAPIEEKEPLVIPQPPELPPLMIPKFSVPVIIGEPPAHQQENDESADIEVMPIASIQKAPKLPLQEEQEVHFNKVQLALLPAAPELPAFAMPELPIQIMEHELPQPAAPFVKDEPVSAPIPIYIEPFAPLPAAPKLPSFVMPEFPIRIIEQESPMPAAPCLEDIRVPAPSPIPAYVESLAPLPAAPELPEFVMPDIPEVIAPMPVIPSQEDEPALEPILSYVKPLAPLPAAPELPVFVMPEIPAEIVEEKSPMPAAPCLNDELIPAPISTYVAPLQAAPELPPFELPEFTVRVAEYPMPAAPFLPIPKYGQLLPEFNYNMVDYQPMSVPQPPELPSFVMPEPSIQVVDHDPHMLAAPYLYEKPSPAPVKPLAPIPAAPELPTMPLPEIPIRIEIPSAPVIIEQPYEEPDLDEKRIAEVDYNTIEYQPMVVPQPPELPAFLMPELPIRIAEQELAMPAAPYTEPLAPVGAVPEYIKPLAPVPAAPELPPANLPEIPIRVEIPMEPELKASPEPVKIPQAPILPELEMPELPVRIEIEERAPCAPTLIMSSPFYQKLFPSDVTLYSEKAKEMQNALLPNQPIDSSVFPMPCVYNLVMQHVLPNMMPHNFKSLENIAIQPVPFVPCS